MVATCTAPPARHAHAKPTNTCSQPRSPGVKEGTVSNAVCRDKRELLPCMCGLRQRTFWPLTVSAKQADSSHEVHDAKQHTTAPMLIV
jgi:hypothetical protein